MKLRHPNVEEISFFVLCVICFAKAEETCDSTIDYEISSVQSKSGPIRGLLVQSQSNVNVSAYYGIPYAEPPVGDLRFSPPQSVTSWSAPLDATKPSPPCYQQFTEDNLKSKVTLLTSGRPWSENCLTLNVLAPFPKPEKAPVVVFIHGGGFLVGNSLWWVDLTTLASQGIVVAAVNYRLGVFGFLSLGNKEVPGNAGLLDQQMAMKWVRDNVDAFGGDPEKVTLMGCSAGSASVGFHLLAPGSQGLFQRAMLMSGAPTNSWATREPEDIIAKSKSLLKDVGCTKDSDVAGLECLRGKDPEDILDATLQPDVFWSEHFTPTVDGQFLVEHPSVSVTSGRVNKADILIGSVSDDAASIMKESFPHVFFTSDGRLFRSGFLKVLQKSQKGLTELQSRVLDVVYTNWSNPDDPFMLRDAAKAAFTDGMFVCGINYFADRMSKWGSRVFRYVFDHKMAFAASMPGSQWMGATHAADQMILTGQAALRIGESSEDIQVRELFQKLVFNFIETGNPNSIDTPELKWPDMKASQEYVVISSTSTVGKNYRAQQCAVWSNLLPYLTGNDNC